MPGTLTAWRGSPKKRASRGSAGLEKTLWKRKDSANARTLVVDKRQQKVPLHRGFLPAQRRKRGGDTLVFLFLCGIALNIAAGPRFRWRYEDASILSSATPQPVGRSRHVISAMSTCLMRQLAVQRQPSQWSQCRQALQLTRGHAGEPGQCRRSIAAGCGIEEKVPTTGGVGTRAFSSTSSSRSSSGIACQQGLNSTQWQSRSLQSFPAYRHQPLSATKTVSSSMTASPSRPRAGVRRYVSAVFTSIGPLDSRHRPLCMAQCPAAGSGMEGELQWAAVGCSELQHPLQHPSQRHVPN